MDGRCPRCRPWTLGQWAHCISLLDWYESPTKCKKVGSCDTCIKPNLVSKIFPFTRGGSLCKFLFQSEHVSSQIWCQQFFPSLGGWGSLCKFFFQSEHVSSQIWCQQFFSLLGGMGVPLQKFFFQSEHVSSQIWCQQFSPLQGGGPSVKFFFQSEHVSSQIWCQKFFSLLGGDGGPSAKNFFPV